jgi:hypothetical protein
MSAGPASGAPHQPSTLRDRRRMQPPRLARLVLDAALATLPPEHRERYGLEVYADLYARPRSEQRREAFSFLLHAQQLAWALADVEPDLDWKRRPRKDVRCVLLLHRYVRRHNHQAEEPKFFLECTRCRNVRHIPYGGIRAFAGPSPPAAPPGFDSSGF